MSWTMGWTRSRCRLRTMREHSLFPTGRLERARGRMRAAAELQVSNYRQRAVSKGHFGIHEDTQHERLHRKEQGIHPPAPTTRGGAICKSNWETAELEAPAHAVYQGLPPGPAAYLWTVRCSTSRYYQLQCTASPGASSVGGFVVSLSRRPASQVARRMYIVWGPGRPTMCWYSVRSCKSQRLDRVNLQSLIARASIEPSHSQLNSHASNHRIALRVAYHRPQRPEMKEADFLVQLNREQVDFRCQFQLNEALVLRNKLNSCR